MLTDDRIRILSDNELYEAAQDFVRQNEGRLPDHSQVQALLQFSQSWSDWTAFVKHQGSKTSHGDREFYSKLDRWNKALPENLLNWGLLPEGLTKKERAAKSERLLGLIIAEFAQHLAAEVLFQSRNA